MEIFKAVTENAAPILAMPTAGVPMNFSTPTQSRKRAQEPVAELPTPSESVFKRPRLSHGKDEASDDEGEAELEFSPMT